MKCFPAADILGLVQGTCLEMLQKNKMNHVLAGSTMVWERWEKEKRCSD